MAHDSFACPQCGTVFLTRDDLRHHIYTTHLPGGGSDEAFAAAVANAAPPEPTGPRAPGEPQDRVLVRNAAGACAIIYAGVQLPPGWTQTYGPETLGNCNQTFAARCLGGSGNHC